MLNIVGERERPNWGFSRDVRFGMHNMPSAHSFREARQIYLSPLHAYCILPERSADEQNSTYLMLSARQSWSTQPAYISDGNVVQKNLTHVFSFLRKPCSLSLCKACACRFKYMHNRIQCVTTHFYTSLYLVN